MDAVGFELLAQSRVLIFLGLEAGFRIDVRSPKLHEFAFHDARLFTAAQPEDQEQTRNQQRQN
jgi:hypothetical protein